MPRKPGGPSSTRRCSARQRTDLLASPSGVAAAPALAAPAPGDGAGPRGGPAAERAWAFPPPFAIQAPTSFTLGYSNGTEPRLAVDGADVYVITSPSPFDGHAVVWRSADGGASFSRAAGELPGQMAPSTDVDIVPTATHRLRAPEQGSPTTQIQGTGFSDHGGSTWKQATGTALADPDRPAL